MSIKVSVIIPNYNGKELLRENLPILFSRLDESAFSKDYEVIIVDDGSNDDSVSFIHDNFPQIRLITLGKNHGFAYACNAGAKEAAAGIIYLLNSDVKVCRGFLEPVIAHFNKKDTFAVASAETAETSAMCENQPAENTKIALVKFRWGIFWYWYETFLNKSMRECETFCVSGGHSAYDRQKFLELGGFDVLFRPFYGEDGDICWRAWKMGWKSLCEPKSVIEHAFQGTISRYHTGPEIQKIHWKNRFLMTWKNLDSKLLILKHLIFIIPELLVCPIIGKAEFTSGFFSALKQLPELIRSRKNSRIKTPVYTDEVLFKRFSRLPRFLPYKILILHDSSEVSGAETSLLKLAKGLDKSEFRPIFIVSGKGSFSRKLRELGIKVFLIDFPMIRRVMGVYRTVKAISWIIKKNDAALVHSNSIRTNVYAAIVARLTGIPVVWHQRNLITNETVDPDRLFSFIPDRIICNSYAVAKRFFRIGRIPSNVTIVMNGVNTEEFNPSISGEEVRRKFNIGADEIVVGIASRFNENKGHEVFLKAAEKIMTDMPEIGANMRFLIAGGAVFEQDKWREKYLMDLTAKLGIENKVVFMGFRDDMPKMYAAMDILVMSSYAEPCGRVTLEAMACAKPVIGTNSGGTPEIVIDGVTGYLVRPKDVAMLAEKIAFLATNRDVAEKFGEAGRKRIAENFKIEKNVEQIKAIYHELLGDVSRINKVSAGLIVRNEEKKIRRCLDSLKWVDEIVIIDQSSQDNTVSVCKEYTDRVFIVPAKDYCEPDRATAVSRAKNEWILYVDADEVIPPELQCEIEILLSRPQPYSCYYIGRKNIFLGKWIRGSDWRPGYVLRLFRKDSVKFSDEIHVDPIPLAGCGHLKTYMNHYTCEDLNEYLLKSDRYISILARQAYEKGARITPLNITWKMLILPTIYFLHRYVIKYGFIDGYQGIVIACTIFRTIFLMHVKLLAMQRNQNAQS